jgi:hypothetical protein
MLSRHEYLHVPACCLDMSTVMYRFAFLNKYRTHDLFFGSYRPNRQGMTNMA